MYKHLLIFLLAGFLLFCAPAPAVYDKEVNFFCDYLGSSTSEKGQNHPNQSFSRMFSYRQYSDGHYQAQFQTGGKWSLVKYKQEVIYRSESHPSRKSFDIERFNLKTYVLTLSHVYHLSLEEYQKRLEEQKTNPYLISYSNKPLPFSDSTVPENHVKVGFDKSHWQCHVVSGLKYILKKWGVTLIEILSSG